MKKNFKKNIKSTKDQQKKTPTISSCLLYYTVFSCQWGATYWIYDKSRPCVVTQRVSHKLYRSILFISQLFWDQTDNQRTRAVAQEEDADFVHDERVAASDSLGTEVASLPAGALLFTIIYGKPHRSTEVHVETHKQTCRRQQKRRKLGSRWSNFLSDK